MSPRDLFGAALRGLSANKLRSLLTVLGVAIGVGAVIVLVAVGNGSGKAVQDRLEAMGTNLLTVSTTGGGGGFAARPGRPVGPAVQPDPGRTPTRSPTSGSLPTSPRSPR